eukprot:403330654
MSSDTSNKVNQPNKELAKKWLQEQQQVSTSVNPDNQYFQFDDQKDNKLSLPPVKSSYEILKDILNVQMPASIAMSSSIFVEVINLAFVGHQGKTSMVAGVGLGNMYINTVAMSVFIGLNNGVTPLVSQSYGQGNLELCGVYFNRGRVTSLLSFIVIIPVLLLAEPFFKLINMDDESSAYAQQYINIIIPSLVIVSQFDITKTFLNCFGYSRVQMIIQLVTTPLHAFWSYIFVNLYQLELQGTAIATIITTLLNFTLINLYITFLLPELKAAWFLPTRDSFKGLGQYLMIAVPSMLMACLEWWTFEIQALFATFISVEAVGSQVIILNIMYIYFCFTIGLQVAGYSLIGQSVGAQNIPLAKQYRTMLFYCGTLLTLIQSGSLFFLRFQITNFFTNIGPLVAIVSETLKTVALVQLTDCTQGWIQGIIRGLGQFKEATFAIIFCLWFICLPSGWIFGIELGYGLPGLWFGMFIGMFFMSSFFIYLVTIRFDWNKIADEAQLRNEKEMQKQEDEKLIEKIKNLESFDNRESLKERLL